MNVSPRLRIVAAAAAIALAMSITAILAPKPEAPDTLEAAAAPAAAPARRAKYIVGEHKGRVAVFTGENELIRVTDAPVSALPAPDRSDLASGIEVDDDTALAMLLEDYLN